MKIKQLCSPSSLHSSVLLEYAGHTLLFDWNADEIFLEGQLSTTNTTTNLSNKHASSVDAILFSNAESLASYVWHRIALDECNDVRWKATLCLVATVPVIGFAKKLLEEIAEYSRYTQPITMDNMKKHTSSSERKISTLPLMDRINTLLDAVTEVHYEQVQVIKSFIFIALISHVHIERVVWSDCAGKVLWILSR